MATANITIRLDEDIKRKAESLFDDIGLTMSTAITVFIKAALRKGRIPFELEGDPFWSEENQERLRRAAVRFEQGHTVTKTMAELEALEHE